jgi:hypothetical protein
MAKSEKHEGSCHCGLVRFEVAVPPDARISRCNCTICRRTGAASTTVAPTAFRLVSGDETLAQYEWGGRTAKRFFCKTCGIHCFAMGHMQQPSGDYVLVNLNCVDDIDVDEAKVVYWDGRHDNWCLRSAPWPVHMPSGSGSLGTSTVS